MLPFFCQNGNLKSTRLAATSLKDCASCFKIIKVKVSDLYTLVDGH